MPINGMLLLGVEEEWFVAGHSLGQTLPPPSLYSVV